MLTGVVWGVPDAGWVRGGSPGEASQGAGARGKGGHRRPRARGFAGESRPGTPLGHGPVPS
eukprot:2717394-Rhodomonas_salina.1